jgi:SNF2 family DNA or RNA helicase
MDAEGQHPFVLASQEEGRKKLLALNSVTKYSFAPDVRRTISEAVTEGADMATPITPVTDFELTAYCDEFRTLKCSSTMDNAETRYESGKRYRTTTYTYKYIDEFTRCKSHHGDKVYAKEHRCKLHSADRAVRVWFDKAETKYVDFLQRPNSKNDRQRCISTIWEYFDKPKVKTVLERFPAKIQRNLDTLSTLEMMAGFTYYDGQREFLARTGCKSSGYIVAEAGCGKSNFALSLIALKDAKRALIVAPQGTVKGEPTKEGAMSASQWAEEVEKFVPHMPVYELFSMDDYYRIKGDRKTLPCGIFVTYFQAMFHNDSCERCSKGMTDGKLLQEHMGVTLPKKDYTKRVICDTIGDEVNGIRSIAKPNMATIIGGEFDMVCVDESHTAQTSKSLLTECLVRLQPKYRFAFSATPIPNDITNLFSVMRRFQADYMSTEEDLTAKMNGDKKVKFVSPIVSQPSHLIKILKSNMSFISKAECNPDYVPPAITNIRIDMGSQQSGLYDYYMDKSNVLGMSQGVKATNQITTLRSVCAEPYKSNYNRGKDVPVVTSPFNPKVIAILEIIQEKLALGEQVCVISSRTTTTDMIQNLLSQCDIKCARIDGKTSGKHAKHSNMFKLKEVPVMLMGIKCAAAHSFSQCRNEIITSIEWSNGVFTQAVGRVDRINSPLPPNIYVILYKNSIEEVMYDMMTMRNDAATLCIKGEFPEPSQPIDMGEILAHSIVKWKQSSDSHDEDEYEEEWNSKIRKEITDAKTKSKSGVSVEVA